MLGQPLCDDGKMSSGSASKKQQEAQKQIPPGVTEAGRDDGGYQGLDGKERRGETSPSPVQGWPLRPTCLYSSAQKSFCWRLFVLFSSLVMKAGSPRVS